MCEHGKQTKMPFNVIKEGHDFWAWKRFWDEDDNGFFFSVDSCLAYTVWKMNCVEGIKTINSCCMHGEKLPDNSGQILIDSHYVCQAIKKGYDIKLVNRVWCGDIISGDGTELESVTYEVLL